MLRYMWDGILKTRSDFLELPYVTLSMKLRVKQERPLLRL